MDLQLALYVGLAVSGLLVVGLVLFCVLAMSDDDEPADEDFGDRALLQAHIERAEVLQRIADRQKREQRQRDAAAFITRGY